MLREYEQLKLIWLVVCNCHIIESIIFGLLAAVIRSMALLAATPVIGQMALWENWRFQIIID